MRRKDFLRLGALFSGGLLSGGKVFGGEGVSAFDPETNGSVFDYADEPIKKVRVAFIGVGNRGTTLLEMMGWMVRNGHAEITAICDVQPKHLERAKSKVKEFQASEPQFLDTWKMACDTEIADLVVVATPWRFHASMAIYAMKMGLHVATEVPMAYTLHENMELIRVAEQTQRHCIMLENCCYNGEELFVLNMVKEGVFGDLTHAECAYIHDLRALMMDTDYYHKRWRLNHHLERNGNFYTTHGLGPVCMYMDILRGDNLSHLVSMSSNEAALSKAMRESEDSVMNGLADKVKCGDVNTTLIKTEQGRSIMLQFDVHTGRPYNRLNKLSGTNATHYGYPSRLYIDHGPTWDWHAWEDSDSYKEYREAYDHPMWTKLQKQISENEQGHGGMDFVMMYRLIRALNHGVPLDMNVYDGALWSIVGALSEVSVQKGDARVNIPDITNGAWTEKREHPVFRDLS